MLRRLRRLCDLIAWRVRDRDIQQEMSAHLEALVQEYRDAGLSEEAARLAARKRFGSPASIKDRGHDVRGAGAIEHLLRDVRYAARGLVRAPGFAVTAAATLALAIGASTAIFTVTHRVLLNPLPYPDSDRILMLDFGNPAVNLPSGFRSLTSQQYFQYVDRARTVSSIAVYQLDDVTIAGRGAPERITVARVTPSLASVLGVSPVMGRWFAGNEGVPGAAPVAILSYGLWMARYGGNPAVLGQPVDFDGVPTEIVGVMPRTYAFPERDVDA